MFEIVGKIVVWLIGLIFAFYIPAIIVMRRQGGLEIAAAALYAGGGCAILYLISSLIYFAFT